MPWSFRNLCQSFAIAAAALIAFSAVWIASPSGFEDRALHQVADQ